MTSESVSVILGPCPVNQDDNEIISLEGRRRDLPAVPGVELSA